MLRARSSLTNVLCVIAFGTTAACSGGGGSSSPSLSDGGDGAAASMMMPPGDAGTAADSSTSSGSQCEHVIGPAPHLDLGESVQAITSDGTDIFLLTTASTGDRLIWLVKNGATTQVADVPSDSGIDIQVPHLLVDANNYYVDATRSGVRGIYRVPRAAGGAPMLLATVSSGNGHVDPLFVADETYLYYEGKDLNRSLTRIPMAGGTPEIIGDAFTNTGNFGGVTIAVDGTSFYAFINDTTPGSYSLSIIPKTPPVPNAPPPVLNTLHYTLGQQCTSGAAHLEVTSAGYFAPCTDNASVPASSVENWLYALPTAAPNATGVAGTILATEKTLDIETFAVASGNVYYDDSHGSTSQAFVYKVAAAGGAPTQIMKTKYVSAMGVVGTSLAVASGCGVQEVGL